MEVNLSSQLDSESTSDQQCSSDSQLIMQIMLTFILALLVPLATAQWGTIENGTCPEFSAMDTFDLSKWYGRWYDIFHVHWYFGGTNVACVTADYTEWGNPEEHGLLYQSANSMNLRMLTLETPIQVNSFTYDSGVPGEFITQFGPNPPEDGFPSNFNVLDTNFDSYSCIYNCEQLEENLREVMAFGMSRNKEMDPDDRAQCESLFSDLDLDVSTMVNTKQDKRCIYYPEH
ncbi:unnamed protein product [Meganyctiphanes norvegica]|uniref:Uncharacterized protein n=1 Tax=Meganyctiphanes norvegica TaxID=48144 RepID=A0AAV2RX56_MEGNR